jgi:heme-degrading monooxygenase HmoA
MYTRIVELTTKPETARELCAAIDDKVLSILKKQAGLVDETVLASDTDSNRVLALSFWNAKEDAERYHRSNTPRSTRCSRTSAILPPLFGTSTSPPRRPIGSPQAKPPNNSSATLEVSPSIHLFCFVNV